MYMCVCICICVYVYVMYVVLRRSLQFVPNSVQVIYILYTIHCHIMCYCIICYICGAEEGPGVRAQLSAG
jgi:hypothetical protein